MGVEEFAPVLDYEVNDSVRVIDGPLENFIGTVEEINFEKKGAGRSFHVRQGDTCGIGTDSDTEDIEDSVFIPVMDLIVRDQEISFYISKAQMLRGCGVIGAAAGQNVF